MRLAALSAVVIMLCLSSAFAQLPAPATGTPGTLPQDWWSFNITAGYSGYALPVANSGLGRNWAAQADRASGLTWQIGRNISVVPVRLDIVNRAPNAFKGRIEIVSAHGYAREEDPLGHLTYFSREIIVPPGIPTTLVMAPRVCPVSEPGQPVRLLVRLYRAGAQESMQELSLTVTQLEPYYLYSLYLDGPEGAIYRDAVNPRNKLQLRLRSEPTIEDSFYQSANFTLTAERQWVTKLPLAARDFAFVLADLQRVKAWPRDEQEALVQFMLGGGHLCLFNAGAAQWLGLPLRQGPQEVARGRLLPVAGGILEARQQIVSWLEGEIEELVLWGGGSSGGQGLATSDAAALLQSRLRLDLPFAKQQQGPFISRRQGYMHPVWIYRETCLAGAIEPWDFPEFVLPDQNVQRNNPALRQALANRSSGAPAPLVNFTLPSRGRPALLLVLLGLALGAVLARGTRLPRYGAAGLALAALGAGGALWSLAAAQPGRVQHLQLLDQDARCAAVSTCRELLAAQAGSAGTLSLPLESDPVIRRVQWEQPGSWSVEQSRTQAAFQAWTGADFLSVAADASLSLEQPANNMLSASRVSPGRYRVRLGTLDALPNEFCYLIFRNGVMPVPGGRNQLEIELEQPPVTVTPGWARLRALAAAQNAYGGLDLTLGVALGESQLLLRDLLAQQWPGWMTGTHTFGPPRPQMKTVWSGLLQEPQLRRGMLGNQIILLAPVAVKQAQEPQVRVTRIQRLALPLAGAS